MHSDEEDCPGEHHDASSFLQHAMKKLVQYVSSETSLHIQTHTVCVVHLTANLGSCKGSKNSRHGKLEILFLYEVEQ